MIKYVRIGLLVDQLLWSDTRNLTSSERLFGQFSICSEDDTGQCIDLFISLGYYTV